MTKQVKIVTFDDEKVQKCEQELTRLVNEGWIIVAAGGNGYRGTDGSFIVLQKG